MGIWDTVIETGVKAAGSYLAASGDKDRGNTEHTQNVVPKTESTSQVSDFDILYNANAVENMYNLTEQMNTFTAEDRTFFSEVYQPYQESIVSTNQALLPTIEKVAGRTLELNAQDMLSNENLKTSLRSRIGTEDAQVSSAFDSLRTELDNVPTEQEAVGKALSNVEGQFKGAGKALARDFASRGQAVSQASRRDLAFQKAEARAGAAGAASDANRAERLAAAEKGVGAELSRVSAQSKTDATDVASLATLQGSQQAGLATPQVGGVRQTTGLEGAGVTADLTKTGAEQTFGTRQKQDDVTQVQKGIKSPALTSGATGNAPRAGGVTSPGGSAGPDGVLSNKGAVGTMLNTIKGVVNPK